MCYNKCVKNKKINKICYHYFLWWSGVLGFATLIKQFKGEKIMRKGFIKVLTTTALLSMLASSTVFAGQWKSDNNGWWYQNDDGSYPTNTWQWIDGNSDGVSESYYFNENGYMLANSTKDGYTVNADGAWTVNGVVQTQGQPTAANPVQNYDEQYPLKGRVEKYLDTYEGNYVWYWTNANLVREGLVPAGMTPMTYRNNRTVADKDITYNIGLSGNSIDVLAKLAGLPDMASSNSPEVIALANEVKAFMNSFDWRNASDLEKATRICERIHRASYDHDAANEAQTTGWSDSLSYTEYGCLVNGKAVCQGYTGAANLLGLAVGLKTFEMGDVGHTYPVFLVEDVWLGNEPTTQNKYFTVEDVYRKNVIGTYQMLGQYCEATGYTVPTDKSMLSQFGTLGEEFGKTTIQFKSEYR